MTVSHCLIVGGTGMLRGVTLALAERCNMVSVVARTEERLRALRNEAPDRIHPIALDWHEDTSLRCGLTDAVARHGSVGLSIVWIHSTAPRAPLIVADAISDQSRPCRYVHVLGSGSDERTGVRRRWREALSSHPGITYQRVVLGSVMAGGRRRWLSHDEICEGVLGAIEGAAEVTRVGEVE